MIKSIVAIVLLGIAALLAYAAAKPDTFVVERRASIRAPAARLHGLINDLHQFNTWNPYNRKDPNVKGFYRGPLSGPGAHYDFDGNKEVGKGSLEITASTPEQVSMRLDMIEPFEGHNQAEFVLVPQGDATEVTWRMHGPAPLPYKVASVFMNMDHVIGRDFETGLNNLKALAERNAP